MGRIVPFSLTDQAAVQFASQCRCATFQGNFFLLGVCRKCPGSCARSHCFRGAAGEAFPLEMLERLSRPWWSGWVQAWRRALGSRRGKTKPSRSRGHPRSPAPRRMPAEPGISLPVVAVLAVVIPRSVTERWKLPSGHQASGSTFLRPITVPVSTAGESPWPQPC